ncbi:MAG: hypothetical protein KAJ06_09870 [Gammaproteobacteria bacterium]|nr:hypothetical protein [Gammaproteobacteria bacterium]
MPTHAIITSGTGGTAALAKTQIGSNLTLPAGGPWIISGLFGQVVKSTAVPSEGTGGQLIIDAASGDITPDPSPGKWPMLGAAASSSANSGPAAMGLNIWPINVTAQGKAVISLFYVNQLAITTGSPVQAGIIFGDSVPAAVSSPFCDSVAGAFASASEQSIGTITLSERSKRITGILAELNKGDAWTTAEYVIGFIRLASDSMKMQPAQFPCAYCYNAGDGTIEGETAMPLAAFIPVDIPVERGALIDVFAKTPNAVTGNVEVRVSLMYE